MAEGRNEKGHFTANNLFSLGLETSGRPPIYDNHEKMMEKVAEYLNYEDSLKRPDSYSKVGKGVYTLSGLALFCGFASLQSLYDYEKRSSDFSYVLNRFRLFMKHWNEQKLYWGGTFQGSFVWLKNHGGYSDETQNKSTVELMQIEVVKSDVPFASSEDEVENK